VNVVRIVVGTMLAVVGIAALLVVLALALVVTTPVGVELALRAAAPLVPGRLEIRAAGGSLATALVLRDVRYTSDAATAAVESVTIDLGWAGLADGRFVLDRVAVADGELALAGGADSSADAGPPRLPQIPDGVAVRSIEIADIRITGAGEPIDVRALDGRLDGPRLTLDRLALERGGVSADAAGEAVIDRAGVGGRVEGEVVLAGAAQEDAHLSVLGTFELDADAEPWFAAFEWSRLAWQGPPLGEASSPSGRVVAVLGASPPRFELAAVVDAARLPGGRAELDAAATLAGDALALERLDAAVLGGMLHSRGGVDLGARSGYASIDFADLEPSLLDARLAGVLGGRVDVAAASEPALRVSVVGDVAGRLGERPLEGSVQGSYANGGLHIARAEVTLDDGRLSLAGALTREAADLSLVVQVPELGYWYPPASGTVIAAGTVTGDPSNPQVDFELEAERLALADSAVPPIAALEIGIDGVRDAHRVRVAARGDFGSVRVATEQGVEDRRVDGRLTDVLLALERVGTWRLASSAAFRVAPEEAALERACLAGPDGGELCVDATGRAASVVARALPNALASPWLPNGVALDGYTDASLAVDWSGPIDATLELRQRSMIVSARADDDREPGAEAAESEDDDAAAPLDVAAELRDVAVVAALTGGRLEADLGATLAATGDPIRGELALSPLAGDGRIDGRLTARLTDLALVDALVDGVERLEGELDVELAVAGTLDAPELRGTAAVRSLAAALPPLGIEIGEGRLSARAAGLNELVFDGTLCSGGCVRLDGRLAAPNDRPWRLDARVQGERFVLADLPDVRAVVSPALVVAVEPEAVRISGDLGIPEGRLEVDDVPRSAVRPAPETVVHGRAPPEREQALPLPLAVRVSARLGDVRFSGLGIEAELDGLLDVERGSDGAV